MAEAIVEELASLAGDNASQQAILDSLQRKALAQANRQALIAAGATHRMLDILNAQSGSVEDGAALDPGVASKAMELLTVLCCDDQSRAEAVDAGAVGAIVNVAPISAKASGSAGQDDAALNELRVCTVKALLNFTQGSTKTLPPILASVPVFISAAMFYPEEDGRDTHGQLRMYALMGLSNIANGGTAERDEIIRCGVSPAISRAIESGKGQSAPALKLLLALCSSDTKDDLLDQQLAAALRVSLQTQQAARDAGAVAAREALKSTCKAVTALAGGNGRDLLVKEEVAGGLARVVQRKSGETLQAGRGGNGEEEGEVRMWGVKGLERVCKCSAEVVPRLLQQEAVEALVEGVRKGRVEEQEYALRGLVTVAGGGPGEGVTRFVGAGGLEAVRGVLERCCGAGAEEDEDVDDVAIKALHLVTLACRVDPRAQSEGASVLLATLSRIAQSRDATLQDLAVKALLNLGRAGEDAKAQLASADVLHSLNSVVRVEGGAVQLNAIKTVYHLTRLPECHAPLLQHGAVAPLLEVCEVAEDEALQYALRALQALCASKPPIRTHLLRCDVLPVLVRCVRGDQLPNRCVVLDALSNLAKDNTVAPLMVKEGVVELAVRRLREGDVQEQRSSLLLLQRLSTAARILHALVSAGVVAAATGIFQAESHKADGGAGGAMQKEMLLLAGLCVAPLLDSGSSVPDVPPQLWRLIKEALEETTRGAPLQSEGARAETADSEEAPAPRRRLRLSQFEVLLALRHFASHKLCRPSLTDAGIVPLLAAVVARESRDPSLPCLAAQALFELATDRQVQGRAGRQAQEALGEEYLGHLALAANRLRPSSPDELDMLLVM